VSTSPFSHFFPFLTFGFVSDFGFRISSLRANAFARRNFAKQTATAILLALLTGCATTPKSHFYVLQPREWNAPALKTSQADSVTIGLHPVSLPDYLDRPQIVTGTGGVGIEVAEFHRWGESLECGVERVLCSSLKKSLPPHNVLVFPWGGARPELQIRVVVNTFLATPGGKARLTAECCLFGQDGQRVTHAGSYERPVAENYTSIVLTMSALVDDLGRELAEKILESSNVE